MSPKHVKCMHLQGFCRLATVKYRAEQIDVD